MNNPTNRPNKESVNNYRTSKRIQEQHPNAKLTTKEVQQIRALGSQGVTTAALAERFKMSKTAIKSILSYRTWKNVPDN